MKDYLIILIIGTAMAIALFWGGYWYRGSKIPEPNPVVVTSTVNVDSLRLEWLRTSVSHVLWDSLAQNNRGLGAHLRAIKSRPVGEPEGGGSLVFETGASALNYHADTTIRIPIRILTATSINDSLVRQSDSSYAIVRMGIQFLADPVNQFHNWELSVKPIRISRSITLPPRVEYVYEGRGFWLNGLAGWQSNIGGGVQAGFGRVGLGWMAVANKEPMYFISYQK